MTHKDEIRSVEWKVEVKSRKAQPNIFVRGVDSFVLFEQVNMLSLMKMSNKGN